MVVNTLKLIQFKNYQEVSVQFAPGIVCLFGKNGSGKTNLLDALHYLSMTRSAFQHTDTHCIQHGGLYFAIHASLEHPEFSRVQCYFENGQRKVIKVEGSPCEKLSDHIGRIPSVLITPDHSDLIREGSEIRRKLFDSVISQSNTRYLQLLIRMQHLLKQRNSLLKNLNGQQPDARLVAVYDEQLLPVFEEIARIREQFIQSFQPYFEQNYAAIFDGDEMPEIKYRSEMHEPHFAAHFREALAKDVLLQRTTLGAHRDDYTFKLNGRAVKKFGSQGQQKSFLLALKLAEYDYLRQMKGFDPLLLLDDIFDKLDDERIHRLVTLLSDSGRFGQVFITDAREERSRQFFAGHTPVSFYTITEGTIQ